MNRNIFLWALYDFANSFIYIAFFLYFSQWVVIDNNIPDMWFNLCFVAASILLLLTAPIIGIKLDEKWKNIYGLRITTLAIISFYALTGYFAINGLAISALIFFAIGQYFFALSFTFYTPLINTLSSSYNRGRISGFGFIGNFTGNIAGLLLAMPFAMGKINLFGGTNRAETILPAIIAFAIFSLPMLLFFKESENKQENTITNESNIRKAISIFKDRNILFFLIAFTLFNGAIFTVISNIPIILERVWNIADNIKTLIALVAIIVSVVGSFAFGYITDKLGYKRTLALILISWIVVLIITATMFDFYHLAFCIVIIGLLIGANMTVSRAAMANLISDKNHNLGFSYFNIIERASAIIGPIVWGIAISGFAGFGMMRYNFALGIMAVIILIGLLFVLRIKPVKETSIQDMTIMKQ